jgi:hypothetical protein
MQVIPVSWVVDKKRIPNWKKWRAKKRRGTRGRWPKKNN